MITIIIMGCFLVFLGGMVLFADTKAKNATFFDINTTNCLRGFWCLIVVLVHIPDAYQNFIQDALGSFAYIGVSFFFMTSSYGLTLGVLKNPQGAVQKFWSRRLFKLLIPMVLVNIVRVLVKVFAKEGFEPLGFIGITGFVRQLLFFYFLFWLVFRFLPKRFSVNTKCGILCGCVVVFSLIVYFWENNGLFAWPTESFGFMYGMLLALNKERFVGWAKKKWLMRCAGFCGLAFVFGLTYLKFKSIVFAGDYLLKIVLGVAILLFMLLLNVKFPFGNPVSRFLGDISYEVYLVHDVVFIALTAVCATMNSGVFVLSSLVGTIVLSLLIHIVSKPILALCQKKR